MTRPSAATLLLAALLASPASSAPPVGAGADWIGYDGTLRGDRWSQLAQITTANVASLRPTCTFDTHESVSFQSAPAVVDGVMVVTTDMATYAFDAATCESLWKNEHPYSPAQGLGNNRGATILDGRVYRVSGDVHAYALDAKTGRTIWDVAIGDRSRGESAPLAPLAWNGLVFAGNAGGDNFGVTGRIVALDAADGHEVWRFDTVPSSGPARATWPEASDANPPTGGATWTSYTLDERHGVLYASTGNPAPDFVLGMHPGASLYTTCIVALDARTGRLLAYVQPVTDDFHDWDIAPPPAIVTTRSGKALLIAAAKDGRAYGIDRSGLEAWLARPGRPPAPESIHGDAGPGALRVAWATPITTRTNVRRKLSTKRPTRFCPGTQGGAEWNGAAYDPTLDLVFTGAIDWCTSVQILPEEKMEGGLGKPWTGSADPEKAFGVMDPKESWGGFVTAMDADSGRVRWQQRLDAPVLAGVTATAGGVVFTGDVMGNVLAFDAKTGAILWKDATRNSLGGGVVTYMAGGAQRVAVAAGMKSPIWPVPVESSRVIVYSLP